MTLQIDSTLNLNGDAALCIHGESLCVKICATCLHKMYSTYLKKKKKKENGDRNQKHVFVPDEELEEEA